MITRPHNVVDVRRPGAEAAPAAVAVRRMSADDVGALVELERQCFRTIYRAHRFDRADFARFVRAARGISLVAAAGADRALCGYVTGGVRRARGLAVGVIDSVAVGPAFQGRGIGRALAAAFVGRARAAGCARVLLEVGVENVAARGLYRSMGFREYRTARDYYAPGSDALRLRLDLHD